MKDNIFLGKLARNKLVKGIAKTTAMIRGTYGAAGGNVVLEERVYPFHSVRNDGKAIVDKVNLEDPIENMGAQIIKEVGDKADKDSGDGRKTTMILTEAIFIEADKSKELPLAIKRSLDECVPIVLASIDAQKKEITVDDVGSVARISSESDEIGNMMQEIYQKIGKEGIVEVDNSNMPETFYEVTEGVRLRNAGYFGGYAITEPGKAVYKNPKILISRDKITSSEQLEPVMRSLASTGSNELVIYCDDIDISVASRLAYTHLSGGFKTLIIKSPTLWKDWLFEDFALITGATVVNQKEGKSFSNLSFNDLGTCEKIIVTKDETRVIGIKDISAHLAALVAENTDESKLRASWLQTKVAILKVGASSESELSYISKKAKDASHASYLALKDGVVAGGGVALVLAIKSLPDTVGGRILKKAFMEPMLQIISNAGFMRKGKKSEPDLVLQPNEGFDARTGKSVDMFEAGIVDPALVVKNCVRNAVSIASTVLTLRGIIVLPKQDSNEIPKQVPFM